MRFHLLLGCVLFASAICPLLANDNPVPDLPYGAKPYQLFDWYPALSLPNLPAGPRPWVLFAHGTGTDKTGVSMQSLAVMLDSLRHTGITVFAANWGNYPEIYPTPLADITRAVQYLKANAAQFDIDPARSILWGNSAGATICGWLSYGPDMANSAGTPQEQQSTRPVAFMNWGGLSNFLLMDPNMSAVQLGAAQLKDLPQSFLQQISFSEQVAGVSRAYTPLAQSYYGSVSGPLPYTNPHDIGLMVDFHAKLQQSFPDLAAKSLAMNNPNHPHVVLPQVETLVEWTRSVFGYAWPLDLGHGTLGSTGFPKLWGTGPALASQSFLVSLKAALPAHTAVFLVAGTKRLDANISQLGIHLVPKPTWFYPAVTDATGRIDMLVNVPAGTPAGVTLYLQMLHWDPASQKGMAASNAIKILTK